MTNEKTVMAAAANLLAPAFSLLKEKGYEVRFDAQQKWWVAEKNGLELIAYSTIELCGLAYIHENKGSNWAVSDDEIDIYLKLEL